MARSRRFLFRPGDKIRPRPAGLRAFDTEARRLGVRHGWSADSCFTVVRLHRGAGDGTGESADEYTLQDRDGGLCRMKKHIIDERWTDSPWFPAAEST